MSLHVCETDFGTLFKKFRYRSQLRWCLTLPLIKRVTFQKQTFSGSNVYLKIFSLKSKNYTSSLSCWEPCFFYEPKMHLKSLPISFNVLNINKKKQGINIFYLITSISLPVVYQNWHWRVSVFKNFLNKLLYFFDKLSSITLFISRHQTIESPSDHFREDD